MSEALAGARAGAASSATTKFFGNTAQLIASASREFALEKDTGDDHHDEGHERQQGADLQGRNDHQQ